MPPSREAVLNTDRTLDHLGSSDKSSCSGFSAHPINHTPPGVGLQASAFSFNSLNDTDMLPSLRTAIFMGKGLTIQENVCSKPHYFPLPHGSTILCQYHLPENLFTWLRVSGGPGHVRLRAGGPIVCVPLTTVQQLFLAYLSSKSWKIKTSR